MKFTLTLLAILLTTPALAQVGEYNFFPAALMQSQQVSSVKTYSTANFDSTQSPRHTIRLSKDLQEEKLYNPQGKCTQILFYHGTDKPSEQMTFEYNEANQLTARSYQDLSEPAPLDLEPGAIALEPIHTIRYHYQDGLLERESQETMRQGITDVRYTYDDQHRRLTEVTQRENSTYTERYLYTDQQIRKQVQLQGEYQDLELFILDAQGRVSVQEYFSNTLTEPHTTKTFTYNPDNTLREVTYSYHHLKKGSFSPISNETIREQHTYDPQGKLIQTITTHRDGTQSAEWYDYTHFDE